MIERLGMIGVSWRSGSTESLAAYTLDDATRDQRLAAFAQAHGIEELVYLATCNRVELIFLRADLGASPDLRQAALELLTGRPAQPGEAGRKLKAWDGEGAVERLFLVASALDSACLGEAEVSGQVRAAYERARAQGLCGTNLEILFSEAQRVAARVRSATGINNGRVSLGEIAADMLKQRYAASRRPVALIGVSPMTERAAVSLHAAGIPLIVVNRTAAKARALAEQYAAAQCTLEAFRAHPTAISGLLSATGAPEHVLDQPALARIAAGVGDAPTPLLIDMAVPADIDAEACRQLGLERAGMNEIVAIAEHNRRARADEAAAARELVDEALFEFKDHVAELSFGPLMGALQQRYRHTADRGLERLLGKELKGLGETERAAIVKWTHVLARRFAHIPCLGLRGLLRDGPDGAVDAFLGGLEAEFADELRAAMLRRAEDSRV